MKAFEALLFDFDGTIVDSAETISHCFNGALSGRNLPPADERLIRSMIGRPLTEMFAAIVEGAGEGDVQLLVASYRSYFRRIHPAEVRLLPGAAAVLAEIGSACPVGIVTSRTASGTRRILEAHTLAGHVSTVVGIEDVSRSKPHPEPVRLALRRLGADPGVCLMVGDTTDDIEAGRRAGVATVGVTTGAHSRRRLQSAGADRVVDSLEELRAWLRPGSPEAL